MFGRSRTLFEAPALGDASCGGRLLQVFEGELDLTVLAAEGAVETTLKPGAIFVVPKGVWHSPRPRGTVTLLFVSDTRGTKISNREDPRTDKSTG